MNAALPADPKPVPPTRPFTVCVYCGSRDGDDPAFLAAASACGQALAQRGWGLVYGGGNSGLMGAVANAALNGGSSVVGIIPERLVQREIAHPAISRIEVVGSMHERKHRMAQLSDAFLTLPGGIGTLEEMFEIWTWRQLGYHRKPLGLLNVNGYFDALLSFIQTSQDRGFLWPQVQELLLQGDSVDALLGGLHAQAQALGAAGPEASGAVLGEGGVAEGT